MSDDPDDVPLELVLEAAAQAITSSIQTTQPGIITEYDHASQRATVRPSVQRTHVAEDDSDVLKPQPEIPDAIVLQMGPSRGRITFPIKVGDACLIFHTCVAIDRFKLSGGAGVVDPGNPRRHHLSDAVVMVCMHTFNSVPTDAPDDALVLWAGDGVTVKVGGATGTQKTMMADLLKSALDILMEGIRVGLVAAGNTATGGAAIGVTFQDVITAVDSAFDAAKTTKTEVK